MGVVHAVPAWYVAAVPRAGEAVEKGYRSSHVRAGYSRFWNMLFHLRSIVVRAACSASACSARALSQAHAPLHTAQLLGHSHSPYVPYAS